MSVAQVALAVQDMINEGNVEVSDLRLERVLLDVGIDDMKGAVDPDGLLVDLRKQAGGDWQRVLDLLIFWYLSDLMDEGYFRDE